MVWTVSNSECDFLRGLEARFGAPAKARAFHSAIGAARRKPLANAAGLDDNRLMNTSTPILGSRSQDGFTLIELMVTIGVMAILIMVAAPGIRDLFMNVRMSAHTNDLMGDLALARSEAIKRGATVGLCPSPAPHTTCNGTDWKAGWMVFVDADGDGIWANNVAEAGIKSHGPAPTDVTWSLLTTDVPNSGGVAYLRYRPTGVISTAAAVTPIFQMCDGRATQPNRGREIVISATGRAIVRRLTC